MNDLDGLARYRAELMIPTPSDYGVARRERNETYLVDYRLATGVEHVKHAVDGLVEVHEYINRKGIAHPAVLEMARQFEVVYGVASARLINDRMSGRSV